MDLRLACTLMVAFLAGCTTAPGNPQEASHVCGGSFPDGVPVHCEQRAAIVGVEGAVPPGWVPTAGGSSNNFDGEEFYASPTGDELGVWFHASPRSEGDFESPHPTTYGGFLRVDEGPLVAWESEAAQGFIRYPLGELRPPGVPLSTRVDFLLYVPVVNADDPVMANATIEPLWAAGKDAAGSDDSVRVVQRIHVPDGTERFLHEGHPDVEESAGSSFKTGYGTFHLYVLLGCGCLV